MKQHIHPETMRLSIQADLDKCKTALERNKLGQFATPTILAQEVLAYGLSLIPERQGIRFLDPAKGQATRWACCRILLRWNTYCPSSIT